MSAHPRLVGERGVVNRNDATLETIGERGGVARKVSMPLLFSSPPPSVCARVSMIIIAGETPADATEAMSASRSFFSAPRFGAVHQVERHAVG